jgi:cysteine desulfurase
MKMSKIKHKRIYLDYASGAPVQKEVSRVISKHALIFANPSSIHRDGVQAKKILDEARSHVAEALYAHSDEIVFTGSGTESDNMAVLGVFKQARLSPDFKGRDVHIITSVIEHPSVLYACRHIEEVGGKVTYLSVDNNGQFDLKELKNALTPNTVLVSIAFANNEIGTIQPIKEIAKEIRRYRKVNSIDSRYPLLHTDACQAGTYLDLNVEQLGVDLMTLNGTKLGGPHGIGVLYLRRGTQVAPIIYGGGQENGFRSGTEDVARVTGMALSLKFAQKNIDKAVKVSMGLQKYFETSLVKKFPDCRINGGSPKLPNNVSVSFKNISSELLVLELDAKGISASAGSACSSAKDAGSHVIEALYGKNDSNIYSTVRFSFGADTKKSDIVYTLKSLTEILKKYEKYRLKP